MQTPYDSKTRPSSTATKLQAALDNLDRKSDNPQVIAEMSYRLGVALQTQGQFSDAIEHLTTSITLYRQLDSHKAEAARVLNQLAMVYLTQGCLEYANSYLEQALEDPVSGSLALAETLHYFGLLRIAQKKYEQAAQTLTRAVALYDGLGERTSVAKVNIQLGRAYEAQNEYMWAQQAFTHALSILGEDTETPEVADIYHHKGVLFLAQSDFIQAASSLNKALALYRGLNHVLQIGMLLSELGQVYRLQNKPAFAVSSFQQALEAYAEVSSDPRLEVAGIHRWLGELYLSDNKPVLAETSLTQALAMYQALYSDTPEHVDITSTRALLEQTQPQKNNQSERSKSSFWCCFRYASSAASATVKVEKTTENPLAQPTRSMKTVVG